MSAISERAKLLKKNMVYKQITVKGYRKVGEFKQYATHAVPGHSVPLKLCLERTRYLTESMKATEGEPMVVRRAKGLKHILENMKVYISDGELIVGNYASTPDSLPFYPELVHRWFTRALDDGYRDALNEKAKAEYLEMIKYWEGKSASEMVMAAVPKDLKPYIFFNGPGFANQWGFWMPLEIHSFKKVFSVGLRGIMQEIKQKIDQIKASYRRNELTASDYVEKTYTYNAMLIALEGVINFGKRYADKAREMAKEEKDKKRRGELLKIAEICGWVPESPPRTLHEAMQSYFFCELVSKAIECRGQGLGNRLDVMMNPYYQRDKAEGRVTYEGAVELMECLYLKMAERGDLNAPEAATIIQGESHVKDFNICGVTPDGEDATNEFSFIILDTAESVRVPSPSIALRYHSKINPEVILKAIDVIRTGIGYPAIFNDSATIPLLLSRGISLELARDWGVTACVLPGIPGKSIHTCRPVAGIVSLGKCLELALYQGKDKDSYTGKELGAKTPDPRTFTCIEEMVSAYLKQVNFIAEKVSQIDNISQVFYEKFMQRPFTSTLLEDSLEQGKDCTSLCYNLPTDCEFCGSTNAANSLAAIKKFVFDEKRVTMDELIEACRTNFDGKEELRQRLINEAPKFGNDDDYVDILAREVHIKSNEEFMKFKNYYGFPILLDGSIAGGYYGFSVGCGALPDGKKDSEPFADGVMSPSAGTDKKGPTAVLKSVGKITPTYAYLFNQKFLPQFLEGENKKLFAQYLRTYHDLGIYHIQFNVVNKETLLDAQAHPESYQNLVVRVAGYSAYFVDLSRPIQDDIIKRTEQSF